LLLTYLKHQIRVYIKYYVKKGLFVELDFFKRHEQ